jgi:hypothetical protein
VAPTKSGGARSPAATPVRIHPWITLGPPVLADQRLGVRAAAQAVGRELVAIPPVEPVVVAQRRVFDLVLGSLEVDPLSRRIDAVDIPARASRSGRRSTVRSHDDIAARGVRDRLTSHC